MVNLQSVEVVKRDEYQNVEMVYHPGNGVFVVSVDGTGLFKSRVFSEAEDYYNKFLCALYAVS